MVSVATALLSMLSACTHVRLTFLGTVGQLLCIHTVACQPVPQKSERESADTQPSHSPLIQLARVWCTDSSGGF